MKIFIKYSKEPPYLPVAIADSKRELAKLLGTSLPVVESSLSHKRKTYAEVEVEDDE